MGWVNLGLSLLIIKFVSYGRDRRLFCYSWIVKGLVQVWVSSIWLGITLFGVIWAD